MLVIWVIYSGYMQSGGGYLGHTAVVWTFWQIVHGQYDRVIFTFRHGCYTASHTAKI